MRPIIFMLVGGFFMGVAFSGTFLDWDTDSPPPSVTPHRAPAAASFRDAESVSRLKARIAELESVLRIALAGPPTTRPRSEESGEKVHPVAEDRSTESLADVETLYNLVDEGDASALCREILLLLRAGESGYRVLAEFLHGEFHSPRKALLDSTTLVAGLLDLSHRHAGEIAGFAAYLLETSSEREDAKLDGKLRSLLPFFLALHRPRFADLRDQFAFKLIEELSGGGSTRWAALAAMTDLGLAVPREVLADLVMHPTEENEFRRLMTHILKAQQRDGLEALVSYLDSVQDVNHWAVRQALHTLARLRLPEAREILAQYRRVQEQGLRDVAELASNSSSVDNALEYLNSSHDLDRKRQLVRQLASVDRVFLEEVKLHGDAVASEEVRRMLTEDGNDQVAWIKDLEVNNTGVMPVINPRIGILNTELIWDVETGENLVQIGEYLAGYGGAVELLHPPKFQLEEFLQEHAREAPAHDGHAPGSCYGCHAPGTPAEEP